MKTKMITIKKSLKHINWKLFAALLVMGLCPAVWTTVRTFLIGQLPGEYILYLTKAWTPTLLGIALMFGIGNAFDSVVSGAAYTYYLKKNKIKITEID